MFVGKVSHLKSLIKSFDNAYSDDWETADEMPNNYVEVLYVASYLDR
tara:strand:- start:497 stop:637 length:141 start_codon:yes stop_codon:yes gene_type:complete